MTTDMKKLENMFQNIIEQITKLTTRMTALDVNTIKSLNNNQHLLQKIHRLIFY